jgi:hypothetical protein
LVPDWLIEDAPAFRATPASAGIDGTAIANEKAGGLRNLMLSPIALVVEFGPPDPLATQRNRGGRIRIFCDSVKRRAK